MSSPYTRLRKGLVIALYVTLACLCVVLILLAHAHSAPRIAKQHHHEHFKWKGALPAWAFSSDAFLKDEDRYDRNVRLWSLGVANTTPFLRGAFVQSFGQLAKTK